jgi:2-keto-4-pentenoate hydratase/2-oxohepta-3-ene-1,7-dioic acid hydratase in catechol pathway
VPVIKCIGVNYMKHIQEGGPTPPLYSSIFLKARTSIASYDEDVPVPKLAQDDQCNYEGELSIVIGKTGKNIKEEEALDYVAGYVSSNDISSCKWQRDPAVSLPTTYNEGIIPKLLPETGVLLESILSAVLTSPSRLRNNSPTVRRVKHAGGVPQWCFSKGFDKYAPLGPMMASPKLVGDTGNLRIQTFVNGESRQYSRTNDLLFSVKKIISFISQGTALEQGTVIMTWHAFGSWHSA